MYEIGNQQELAFFILENQKYNQAYNNAVYCINLFNFVTVPIGRLLWEFFFFVVNGLNCAPLYSLAGREGSIAGIAEKKTTEKVELTIVLLS